MDPHPPDISIRRATLGDRQGVLDINRHAFESMDYMEPMYTSLLQDPDFWGYVAKVNREIVSFVGLLVDVEEARFIIVGARTKPEYHNRGIYQRLETEAIDRLLATLKVDMELYFATHYQPHTEKAEFWSDPDRLMVMRVKFLTYIAPHSSFVEAVEACRQHPVISSLSVESLNPDRIQEVLTSPYTLQNVLRPPGIIAFCNHLPLPKTRKNLRKIAAQNKTYVSFKTGSTRANGVSFSMFIKGPVYVNCNINVYVYEHVDVLLAHLAKHFYHVSQVVPSDQTVAFRMNFPCEIDQEVVKSFLLPNLGGYKGGNINSVEYVVVGKELQQISEF